MTDKKIEDYLRFPSANEALTIVNTNPLSANINFFKRQWKKVDWIFSLFKQNKDLLSSSSTLFTFILGYTDKNPVMVAFGFACSLAPYVYAYANEIRFSNVEKKAKSGDAEAQFELGVCYTLGNGTEKKPFEAMKWYSESARQENPKGQLALGLCYLNGEGVRENKTEAEKWIRKAADQEFARAQFILGLFYLYGEIVKEDKAEAVKWLRKAADQNLAVAQNSLGYCYATIRALRKIHIKPKNGSAVRLNKEMFTHCLILGCICIVILTNTKTEIRIKQ